MLAEIALSEQSIEEATILFRRAALADPSAARATALILHLRRIGRPDLALHEIDQMPKAERETYDIKALEADARAALGDYEGQIRLCRSMANERPSGARVWIVLANALTTVGRTDEAVKALRRAIRAQPTSGEAYWTLANLKSFKFSASDIAQMRRITEGNLHFEDAINIHFALGKAFEDRKEFAKSFHHYAVANAIRAKTLAPEKKPVSEMVDQSIATFTRKYFEERTGEACLETGPIFVVGMHRAGSTLVEQILASHPLVEGASELPTMHDIRCRLERTSGTNAVAAMAALKPRDFKMIGSEYIERTRAYRRTDCPYFVDKLPANWANVPLILRALPNAKIIDARRHPMACGFSNFQQNYAKGVPWSYSLEAMGTYYRNYWRFMRHFDAVRPGAIHRVINERLIEDPEREIRAMLNYLGLPFEASCLEFHRNARAVSTPSAEQVRRPINSGGMTRWKSYEPWLGKLKDALGPTLEQWES